MDISGFDKLLQESLSATDRVQKRLDDASQRMQNKFNPLNMENVEHVDGDTFRLKDSGREFRVQNDPSYSVDTFESSREVYESRPDILANHKRNYAKLTGRPEWSITINELVERGQVQSEQTRQRMAEMGQEGRLAFKSNGFDDYGRELIQLIDSSTGENFYAGHSGREQNANYDSKFNAGQQLDDIFSGERGRYDAFQGGRGVKGTAKDLGVSLATGTGRMLTGLAQGAVTLIGGNGPIVDRFFGALNEGLDNFHNSALSNEALARNARIDRNRARNAEAFDVRKAQYIREGFSETEAGFFAGAEEFQDTVADLLTEPGYVIDKTVESLPYMIGIAAAGKTAVTQATRLLSNNTLKSVVKAGGTREQAKQSVARYLESEAGKKILSRVATTTGVGTVGLTEALSNSAEVYNSVIGMSEEEARQSDQYNALRQEGMSHSEAVRALGEAAFESTFLPGFLMAAAASAITGAGGFEARLFTRRAGDSIVGKGIAGETGKAAVKGGLTKKAVVGTARNIGRFTRFAGPAGAAEAAEEAIQSGGGEFLSQLARFEQGLGDAPGAGIGAAAGEGALIGLVSGAGFQSLSGGLKKVADLNVRGGSGLDAIRNIRPTNPSDGSPDGDRGALANIKQQKEALFERLNGLADVESISDEEAQEIATQQAQIVTDIDTLAKDVLSRDIAPEDMSPNERQAIAEALHYDTPAVQGLKDDDGALGRVYSHNRAAVDAINSQMDESIEAAGAAAEAGVEGKAALKVAREKMGNGYTQIGDRQYPGLAKHYELITEAISEGDAKEAKRRGDAFANFMNSQRQKIGRLTQLLNKTDLQEGDKLHEFTYKKGSTEAYLKVLENEFDTMTEVRNELAEIWNNWHGKKKRNPVPAAPERNWNAKGQANEERTEQRQTEDNQGQTRPGGLQRKSAQAKTQQKATDSGRLERKGAKKAPRRETPKSEGGQSSNTEQTTKDVSDDKTARRIQRITEILSVPARVANYGKQVGLGPNSARKRLEEERRQLLNGEKPAEKPAKPKAEPKKREPATPGRTLRALDASLDNMNVAGLKRIAKQRGLKGYSKLRKAELLALVRNSVRDEIFDIAEKAKDEQDQRRAAQEPATPPKKRAAKAAPKPEPKPAEKPEPKAEEDARPSKEKVLDTTFEIADIIQQGTEGKTSTPVQDSLRVIAENSTGEFYRKLATRIADALGDRKISMGWVNSDRVLGRYRPVDDELLIGTRVLPGKSREGSMEMVVLHEALHAAIRGWIKRNPDHPLVEQINQIREDFIKELEKPEYDTDMHKHMRKIMVQDQDKIRSQEEIIAWGLTFPMAQQVLRNMESKDGNGWTRFVKWIADVLGLKEESALSDLLTVADLLLDEATTPTQAEAEPVVRAKPKAKRSTDGEATPTVTPEQAKAQETGPAPETVRQNDVLWDLLAATQRLQSQLSNGQLTEDEVQFQSPAIQQDFLRRVETAGVAGALAQIETSVLEKLDQNIPRTEISTDHLNMDQVLAAAESLATSGQNAKAANTTEGASDFAKEGNFARIQSWIGGSFDGAGVAQRIKDKFREILTPTSINHGFEQARDNARSLLQAVPNLHEVLENPKARRQLYNALKLKPAEEGAFNAFRRFRAEYEQATHLAFQELGGKINFRDGNRIRQNPAHLLTDKSGRLLPNVVTAMALESMNWLSGDGAQMNNTDEQIRDILGLQDNTTPNTEQNRLRTAGTLRRNVIDSLGRAAWSHMNLRAKKSPDFAPNIEERMESALGTIMVRALQITQPANQSYPGRVQAIGFKGSEFRKMKGPELRTHEDYSKPVTFLRAMSQADFGEGRFLPTDANQALQEEVRPGRQAFTRVFGVSAVVKEPQLDVPTEENIPRRALRSLTNLSEKMKEAYRFQQKRKWKANVRRIDKLRQFSPEQYLKLGHKYETNMQAVHELEIDNVQGRNRTLMQAFENALQWADEHGDRTHYYTYAMTRTGRSIITSTRINPQSSKIHRFLFGQTEWSVKVNPKDTDLLNNFKLAVAQGLGISVDKMTREAALKALDELVETDAFKTALEQLSQEEGRIELETVNEDGSVVPNELGSMLAEEGTHSLAALMAWQEYLAADGKTFTADLPIEVDGVTNGFAAGLLQTPPTDEEALERIKDLLRATGVLFTEDEEASFAEWLEQEGHLDNYQMGARKTAEALVRLKPGGDLYSAWDNDNFTGRFNIAMGEMMEHLLASGFGPTEQALKDPKVGRDFLKNPLMIIAYGAGMNTVAGNMVEQIYVEAHRQMAEINRMQPRTNETQEEFEARQAETLVDVMNRFVDVSNMGAEAVHYANAWKGKPKQRAYYTVADLYKMIKNKEFANERGEPVQTIGELGRHFIFEDYGRGKNRVYDKSNFTRAMEATYGNAMQAALTDMLKGIREIRNEYTKAVTLMNAIFAADFERRVSAEQAATGRTVGRARRSAILNQMMKEGLVPSIATAYSENLNENLELTAWQHDLLKNENVKIFHDKVHDVGRIYYDENGEQILGDTGSTTTSLTARNPSLDVGVAGVVGTIHSLDGTNAADVFGSWNVLNMFDAWVMSIKDANGVPKEGNDRFYNQHHDYDMGQELNKSLERMMALMEAGDGRLSTATRQQVGMAFIEELKAHDNWSEDDEARYLLEELADGTKIYDTEALLLDFNLQFTGLVNRVTRAKDRVFGNVGRVDQFASDGNSYPVSDKERGTATPPVTQPEKYVQQQAVRERIVGKAQTIIKNMDNGDVNKAVANWLQEDQVRPSEALRVIAEVLNQVGDERFRDVMTAQMRILHQYADNGKTIRIGKLNEGEKGRYEDRRITIDDTQFGSEDTLIETLFHEIVHSATHDGLEWLEENNPDALNQIVDQALRLRNSLKGRKKLSRPELEYVQTINGQTQKGGPNDKVIIAGEYLAHVQSGLVNDDNSFRAVFDGLQMLDATQALGTVVTRGATQGIRLRSSRDTVNNKLFDAVEEQKLESQKLWDNMEQMEALDRSTDAESAKEYREFIQHVMDGVLLPGLASLTNDVMLKVGVQPDGTKNIGEVERGSEKDVLKVQAAGNKLHNPAGMTNQEVFAHELFHAVTGFTIESDTKVRAELRKIYEYAKENLTWEDFMPAEDSIAGDRSAVEAAAKERYDYIFGRMEFDAEGNPRWDQLQEFAAIGMSNKPLALALSRIDAPSAAEPLWDGNILSFLVNLVSRGLELLRGQTLGTRRAQNSADALFKLSQQIVTINQQAQARSFDKKGHMGMWRNSIDARVADRITSALDNAQRKLRLTEEEKKQAGTIKQYLRMGTHAALAQRSEAQQKANREFMRHLGVNKSSALSEIISEILPYNRDDRGGADGKMGFLDLLRHSKVQIDIARQRAIEHTRSYLLSTFDKKDTRTRGERLALTNIVLRTDLAALMRHSDTRTHRDIHQMLGNEQLVRAEIQRLTRELNNELGEQLDNTNRSRLLNMYERQIDSLSTYMTRGVMTEDNGMKNAHNIVRQYNLADAKDRITLKNEKALDPIVDQLATLHAILKSHPTDLQQAMRVIDHEMGRDDDNGFFNLLGMAENYRMAASRDLFENNPVQQRKGYVYDNTDGDLNIEVIMDTPAEQERMADLGMVRIGKVPEDKDDRSAPYPRAMYKGFRGASTWQKATVSLTSTQRQGTSLFEVSGFDPKRSGWNLGRMKQKKNQRAMAQFGKGGRPDPSETIAIPVLDDAGRIVDYTYEMSLSAKQQHLKNTRNNDYFDMVVPRMFGAIPDRVATKKMNSQSAQLMRDEWEQFKDSPEHNFVEVSKFGNARSRDMFNVIPDDMKRELAQLFRGTQFVDQKGRLVAIPIRDEAVNLVMGFRKLSILDLPGPKDKKLIRGQKATFAAKTAEKVWQEIMQLVRIKMAIINPTVVVGNISSNFGILLAEGIPAKYIQAKTSEAIRSMRQYQRDVAKLDKLRSEIGVRRANGQNVQTLVNERERMRAELRHNPVGQLVQEGLFTSIVEDVTSDEDTYREWIVGSALDKLKGPFPSKAVQLTKEAYMVPGSNAFNMAIAATQYGDFIGRYVKFKYETEVKKTSQSEAINNALASFIYYDMPQNRWLQLMNDNGFVMFTKFFLRIQPVIAKLFQENPVKATGVLAAQQALMSPFDENIGTFALFNGLDNRYHPFPLAHLEKLEPTNPSLFQWFGFLGL